jgi:hypothetical protein
MANYIDTAFLGFTPNKKSFGKSFLKGVYVDCTKILDDFVSSKVSNSETVRISPFIDKFGLDMVLNNEFKKVNKKLDEYEAKEGFDKKEKEDFEQTINWKLYIEFLPQGEVKEKNIYSFVRRVAYVKIVNGIIEEAIESEGEDNKNPFIIPLKENKKEEKDSVFGLNKDQIIDKAIDYVPLLDNSQKEKLSTFIKENPKLSAAVAAFATKLGYEAVGSLFGNRKFDITSSLGDASKWAVGGAAATALLGYMSNFMGGTPSAGGTGGGGIGGMLSSILPEDKIVYDGGASRDSETKDFQRCLIRFGGGNLEAERTNLPSSYYALNPNARGYRAFVSTSKSGPIVGIKGGTPEKPIYYGDDGRFGDKTLNAVKILQAAINDFNKDKKSNVQITDPRSVPLAILQSPACVDLLAEPVDSEKQYVKQQRDKMAPVKESKVYKEFSFLSSKNQKLHSTLMEQLKKDLKRG